jgi:hypothetical protein
VLKKSLFERSDGRLFYMLRPLWKMSMVTGSSNSGAQGAPDGGVNTEKDGVPSACIQFP